MGVSDGRDCGREPGRSRPPVDATPFGVLFADEPEAEEPPLFTVGGTDCGVCCDCACGADGAGATLPGVPGIGPVAEPGVGGAKEAG